MNSRYLQFTCSSLEEEIDFILKKWKFVEAEKFSVLVEKCLNLLQSGSFIGIYVPDIDIYKCFISKQTPLIYRLEKNPVNIKLLLFWNNQKDPNTLNQYSQIYRYYSKCS